MCLSAVFTDSGSDWFFAVGLIVIPIRRMATEFSNNTIRVWVSTAQSKLSLITTYKESFTVIRSKKFSYNWTILFDAAVCMLSSGLTESN